ncbi:MAG: carbohydrate-binding domain-containing protein [Lachnospiraceae bacterium]|nr:carbohydrate-binding domain-containing protein [Lachnospiraceae bacterium]
MRRNGLSRNSNSARKNHNKNNRIFCKISVLCLIVMMLVSVVLIIPEKEQKKNTVAIGIDEIGENCIIFNPDDNQFYLNEIKPENVLDDSVGITYKDKVNGVYQLQFNGVDFTTTHHTGIKIGNGTGADVNITLVGENKITVLDNFNHKNTGFCGISNGSGSITFSGDGSLVVSAKGNKGVGIYSSNAVNITSGTIHAYGGTKGETAGIKGEKSVNISGGKVHVEASSNNNKANGITTGLQGDAKVSITGGEVSVNVSGDIDDEDQNVDVSKISGAAISSSKIEIGGGELNIDIKGIHKKGLHSLAEGIVIKDKAKVSIIGDVYNSENDFYLIGSIAICAASKNIEIGSAVVNIDMNNTNEEYDFGVYGIVTKIGDLIINKGAIVNISNTFGIGVYIKRDLIINGGYIKIQSDTQAIDWYYNITLGSTVGLINAAYDYDGLDRAEYDGDEYFYSNQNLAYMEIGEIYDFTLYIDSNGNIYKDSTSGATLSDAEKSSIGISTKSTSSEVNVILDNMYFVTSKSVALNLATSSKNSKITLKEGTENRIIATNEESNYKYRSIGIDSNSNLTIDGEGTLIVDNIYVYTDYNNDKIGINTSGDLTFNNGNINIKGLDMGTNMYGINATGSVTINNGKINIKGGSYNVTEVNGIKGNTVTINGGKVVIDIKDENGNSTTGISGNNAINFNDGVIEISAGIICSKVPIMTSNKLKITKVLKNGGNEENSVNNSEFTTGIYEYVKIIPNYYLIYNSGKLYASHDTSTEVTVPNCDVNNGKIVMDGFEFETSASYGLKCQGNVTLELTQGSKNKISINYQNGGNDNSSVIYGTGTLKIDGVGCLDISGASDIKLSGIGGVSTLDINHSKLNMNLKVSSNSSEYIYGISSNGKMSIYNADIRVNGTSGENTENVSAIVTNNILEMYSSDIVANLIHGLDIAAVKAESKIISHDNNIKINCEGTNKNEVIKGIVSNSSDDINLLCDEIDIDEKGYDLYGIYYAVTNTQLNIEKSGYIDIDLIATENGYGIYAQTVKLNNNEMLDINISDGRYQRAIYTVNDFNSISTGVSAEFDNNNPAGIIRAINTEHGKIDIDASNINILVNGNLCPDVHGLHCDDSTGSITVKNSGMKMNQSSIGDAGALVVGIFSNDADINIEQGTILTMNIRSGGSGTGIYIKNTSGSGNIQLDKAECTIDVNAYDSAYGMHIGMNNGNNSININGGKTNVKGTTRAIHLVGGSTLTLTEASQYNTVVQEVSTEYENGVIVTYPELDSTLQASDINNYRYILIGEIAKYGLKYDANNNIMYKVYVENGTKIEAQIAEKEDTIAGWSIGNRTLTLDDFLSKISVDKAIEIVGDATIELKGKTELDMSKIGMSATELYGVYASDNLTIKGNGTIELERGDYENYNYSEDSKVTFNAINSQQGLEIKGGKYIIKVAESSYNGLSAETISIENKASQIDMDIKAKTAKGIYTRSSSEPMNIKDSKIDINIIGHTTYAENVNTLDMCIYGVMTDGDFTIAGANLKIDINCPKYAAYAMHVGGNMTVNNAAYINMENETCQITLTDDSTWYGSALYVNGNLEIKNSKLEAACTNTDDGYGIEVNGNIITTSANVTAKGTKQAIVIHTDEGNAISGKILAGEQYDGSNKGDITQETLLTSLASYKFVEIDLPNDYLLKFQGGQMYKVTEDGQQVGPITSDEVPGWSVGNDGELLILNGLNLETSCYGGLWIGEESTIELASGSTNKIKIVYSGTKNKSKGIFSSNNNYSIQGSGTLDVEVYRINNYTEEVTTEGITCEGELKIVNDQTNTNINVYVYGGNTVNGIRGKNNVSITNNAGILDIDVIGSNNVSGIYSETGYVQFFNVSNIDIDASGGTNSCGIKTESGIIDILSAGMKIVADTMALNPGASNISLYQVDVYASTSRDEAEVAEPIANNTLISNYRNYKKVIIENSNAPVVVAEVTINWGKLDYTCTMSNWNETQKKYDNYKWTCDTNADKITVTNKNSSTQSVQVGLAYTKNSEYTAVAGELFEGKANGTYSTAYSGPKTVTKGNSVDAYLKLSGEPNIDAAKYDVNVGYVTVTLQ